MKAIICNPRGLQKIGRPLDCNVFRNGYCGIFRKELQMDCDAEPVRVIPGAVHDAQQAAIAAAEEELQGVVDNADKIPDKSDYMIMTLTSCTRALAQLRAVKEEADDA